MISTSQKRVGSLGLLCAVAVSLQLRGQVPEVCASGSAGRLVLQVVDNVGGTVGGVSVTISPDGASTAKSQLSYTGRVEVLCLEPGGRYHVTLQKEGYETTETILDATASSKTQPVRIIRPPGPYVRVEQSGRGLGRSVVRIIDSDGTVIELLTDSTGSAWHKELLAAGSAVVEVSHEGFVTQRARVEPEFKNQPLIFDLPFDPLCESDRFIR